MRSVIPGTKMLRGMKLRWGLMLAVCAGAVLLWSLEQYHRLDRPWGAEHVVAAAPGSPGAARSAVPDIPVASSAVPLAVPDIPVATSVLQALPAKHRALEAAVASLGAEVATLKAALRRSGEAAAALGAEAATLKAALRQSGEAAAGALTTMPGAAPVTVHHRTSPWRRVEEDQPIKQLTDEQVAVLVEVPKPNKPKAAPKAKSPASIPVIPPRRQHAVPDMTTFPNAGKGAAAEAQADSAEQARRVTAIKAAVKHSFDGYKRQAWGKDDVRPVSGHGVDSKFRHAVTLLDSLDTLWLLGLRAEFDESVAWCKTNLPDRIRTLNRGTSAFETIIRSLGGLEGAHALSQDAGLLELATQMGDRLIQIVRPDGSTPYTIGGGSGGMGCASLAESGTYVQPCCDCAVTVL